MAITYSREVLTWQFTDSSLTDSLTVTGGNIAVGRLIVIPWQNGSNNSNILSSVTDSQSNSYAVTAINTSNTNGTCGIAYGSVTTLLQNVIDTITLHWTSTSNDFKMGAVEVFTGIRSNPLSVALDVNAVTGASSGTTVSNPITTVSPQSVIFYAQGQQQTNAYTVGGGFTAIGQKTNNSRLDYGYQIVTTAGLYDPAGSYPSTTNWFGSIANFGAFSLDEDYWRNHLLPAQDDPLISVF